MAIIIKTNDDTKWLAEDLQNMEMSPDASEDPSELHPDGWFAPECDHITLPSALAPGKIE
jgi:hypothetical protein